MVVVFVRPAIPARILPTASFEIEQHGKSEAPTGDKHVEDVFGRSVVFARAKRFDGVIVLFPFDPQTLLERVVKRDALLVELVVVVFAAETRILIGFCWGLGKVNACSKEPRAGKGAIEAIGDDALDSSRVCAVEEVFFVDCAS